MPKPMAPRLCALDPHGWTTTREDGAVRVEKQPVPDFPIAAVRATATLRAPVARILAVLEDQDRTREWMTSVKKSVLLGVDPDGSRLVYSRVGAPFIADRDVVVRIRITVDEGARCVEVRGENTAAPRPLEGRAKVEIPRLEVRWTLRALDAERTQARYEVLLHPGGSVPSPLVNLFSSRMPMGALKNLEFQAQYGQGYDRRHGRLPIPPALDAAYTARAADLVEEFPALAALGQSQG